MTTAETAADASRRPPRWWALLGKDRMAAVAAVVLGLVLVTAVFGPLLLGDAAVRQDLRASLLAPSFDHGVTGLLGTDVLGRSVLARLVEAAGTTLSIAVPAVLCSLLLGSAVGMWAGFHGGRRENVAMRVADVILSFPSLLLAVVVLYVFAPSAANIVLIIALARIPVYLRTARAEAAELKSRLFVDAARTFGTGSGPTIYRHVLPIAMPTLLTVAATDFCFVMLTESSLSFLGIGIQPPEVSWGLMVAQGRQYLQTAWWIAVLPGLAIVVTTVSATVLAAWVRLATDPAQRWRLTLPRAEEGAVPTGNRSTATTSSTTEAGATPASAPGAPDAALAVEDLTVDLRTPHVTVRAVDHVGFSVHKGRTLALLGESGCGKSMTAQAIVGLLDPIARVTDGSVRVAGTDVLRLDTTARRKLAGPALSIVFQDALTALNPVQPVGRQLAEPFRIHRGLSRRKAREKAVELMETVGIPEPRARARSYPHQFSGGMRQRLLIAMAVALEPHVLLADEPTTALDVTVQAQIMRLLRDLQARHDMALVLITHDLAVVAEHADDVAIMYAGTVVETGPVAEVFANPRHPYTKGLLDSVPEHAEKGRPLPAVPGSPPELSALPAGCAFQARCPMARERCTEQRPALTATGDSRAAACHFTEELTHA
ncbi:dipeptide/oligopeptide/nickel ABC transporter permease/ATP-binding protein [Saccharopolyspora sp. NFXS83]|uniref:dipeptide/oligopeptide/nickel ABC transporter permease/ATP-binding protein n=1 Tax=Saccharopolyspora sp. NFXS83 TaxID=2993560 RepID=UPI00224B54E9|nr:dipeptide/oligopeptide/nickel ABC transporter permease/ATP-binding protein [Saccharopolyspora sp. NFXS83]MCX2731893.1 dipeptide/oligopeptide/nickel ABC transporter permease/ATP-binding protein [Saccharopolyspora sp. NFXS83]